MSDKEVGEDESLKSGDIVGQAGIEKVYNALLMGIDGARRVVVNSVGREIRTLEEQEPIEGKRLQLTLDYDLQKAVEDGFRVAGFNGAAVVLDPQQRRSARVREPAGIRPQRLRVGHRSRHVLGVLNERRLKPLQDRAIQGRYRRDRRSRWRSRSPASKKASSPRISARLRAAARRSTVATSPAGRRADTAALDLRHAIEQSCDVVLLHRRATWSASTRSTSGRPMLGLGVKSGIDLPNELQGLVPSTRVEARADAREVVRRRDDFGRRSGRARSSVTPVSMAVYMATLANGGTRVTPHLFKAVDEGKGWEPVPAPPPQSKVDINPEKLQAIRDGLWGVVNGAGTGGRARIVGMDISRQDRHGAGDFEHRATGGGARATKDLRDNGWFVFFAPRDNPEIAGVVFLEHGIHGPNAALDRAAHARHVLRQEGRAAAAADAADCSRLPIRRLQGSADGARETCRRASSSRRTEQCSNAGSTTTSTGRC